MTRANIPTLDDGGVCYIGRNSDGRKTAERLILTENACEAIWTYIGDIDITTINEKTRPLLNRVKSSIDLLKALEQGLTLPVPTDPSFKEIKTVSGDTFGLVKRSKIVDGVDQLDKAYLSKAAVVLSIYTPEED